MTNFADLGLSQKVLSAVTDAGYTIPTPIQVGAIPPALQRRDILGIAQTGTGKTASFVLPMLTLLEKGRARARMEDPLKKEWPFYRLAPSGKAEAAEITDAIVTNWKGRPLALIDDGTIHSRELVESVRNGLAEIGITPVFTDTYRPSQEQQVSLVRRLAKSGATHG